LIKYISSTPTRSIENVGKLENIDGNIMELPSWRRLDIFLLGCYIGDVGPQRGPNGDSMGWGDSLETAGLFRVANDYPLVN
jgi:hypothetical protein